MKNEKLISYLQTIVTNLSQNADGHQIQSRIFESQGFTKLAEKYAEHMNEEREFVSKFIDRILDLGCDVKLEAKSAMEVHTDPVEWIKYDLQLSKSGLDKLKEMLEIAKDDYTTFDILKKYYQDEEEDMYWSEQQLDLIEKIGKQNWLIKQL